MVINNHSYLMSHTMYKPIPDKTSVYKYQHPLHSGKLRDQSQAEAKIVVTVRRIVVVTIRHTTITRIVVPATTTIHSVRPMMFNLNFFV